MEIMVGASVADHYTSQAGLNGIIDTRALHATHYMSTNAAAESPSTKAEACTHDP